MNPEEIKRKFRELTVWKRGGQRAPHKPLLVLYAISRLLRNEPRMVEYETVDKDLKLLLREFGPRRKLYHPEYPFWRLQNDGIWELENAERVKIRKSSTDVRGNELLRYEVLGGFTPEVQSVLETDKSLVAEVVNLLLQDNFPETVHEDILTAVDIDLQTGIPSKRKRDPEFRSRILRAYGYKCAVCGFDVRLGDTLVALEASHIKWHQAGGPDTEVNGLALCTMHHKLFDRGVFTLSDSINVVVSEEAHGSRGFQEWLMSFHGRELTLPIRRAYYPDNQYIAWHTREVFQGPGRSWATDT